VKLLRTVPGVGPRLSEAVVAIIDDPHRFKNGRHVSSYLGMVPRRWQSGQVDIYADTSATQPNRFITNLSLINIFHIHL
jgi:transposase